MLDESEQICHDRLTSCLDVLAHATEGDHMPVTGSTQDLEAFTVTFECQFAATPGQVWRMWAERGLLERWWGPPEYPATLVSHDLTPGGQVHYFMTGPDREQYPGAFRVTTLEEPTRLEFEDYFADPNGQVDPNLPVSSTRVELSPGPDDTTRMTLTSTAPSAEAMEQLIQMGAIEGMTLALGQIDALLTEIAS